MHSGKAQLRERLRQQLNAILETQETARGLIFNISDVLFEFNKYIASGGVHGSPCYYAAREISREAEFRGLEVARRNRDWSFKGRMGESHGGTWDLCRRVGTEGTKGGCSCVAP